jgi:hypothetical protein
MNEIIQYIVLFFVALIIIIPLGFIRMRSIYKDFKTYLKHDLLTLIGIVIILVIILKFIPRHEVGVDITIDNKSNFAEININGMFYNTDKFEKINNIKLNSKSGYIGVKTNDNAKLVIYVNEESILPINKKIKINITDKNIEIKSNLGMSLLTNNYNNNYDDMINLFNKHNDNN